MSGGTSTIRICVRKIPPTIQRENFFAIPVIARANNDPSIHVNFYSAQEVGETSAPPSSTAVLTFPSYAVFQPYQEELNHVTFQMPSHVFHPQIEMAPIQTLHFGEDTQTKTQGSIEEEQEFHDFAQGFEQSAQIPTNQAISPASLETKSEEIPEKLLYSLNKRFFASGGGSSMTKGSGKRKSSRKKAK